jgi:hypothetical protein
MSEPTKEELMAKIAELEKKVEGRKKGTLEFRVGEKGGVSVYGLGRFPVTLYYEQWVRLLDMAKDLRDFLEENKHRLKLKDQEGSSVLTAHTCLCPDSIAPSSTLVARLLLGFSSTLLPRILSGARGRSSGPNPAASELTADNPV